MSNSFIDLKLVNASREANNPNVLIFQKNVAPEFDSIAVAWKVISNLGPGSCHHFRYYYDLEVQVMDSSGNCVPCTPLAAPDGASFEVVNNGQGDVLQPNGSATSPVAVDVNNNLTIGSLSARMLRSGKLLAEKTIVVPGQKATFQFKPSIFITTASEIEESDIIDSAVLQQANTEISLVGVSSATIMWTGGGVGPTATPFQFTLTEINRTR